MWHSHMEWLEYFSKRLRSSASVCAHLEIHYLLDDDVSPSSKCIKSLWSPPETSGWAMRVSSRGDGPSFDLDPGYVGGRVCFWEQASQMDLSPHATWECGTHSTVVQATTWNPPPPVDERQTDRQRDREAEGGRLESAPGWLSRPWALNTSVNVQWNLWYRNLQKVMRTNRQWEQGHKDETNNSIHYQLVSSKFITQWYSLTNVFPNIINVTMKLQACVHLHWTGSVEPSRKTHRDWLTSVCIQIKQTGQNVLVFVSIIIHKLPEDGG